MIAETIILSTAVIVVSSLAFARWVINRFPPATDGARPHQELAPFEPIIDHVTACRLCATKSYWTPSNADWIQGPAPHGPVCTCKGRPEHFHVKCFSCKGTWLMATKNAPKEKEPK